MQVKPRHEERVVTSLTVPGHTSVAARPRLHWYHRGACDEAERSRLRSPAKQMRPEGVGLIATEAQGRSEHELLQDVEFPHVWSEVEARGISALHTSLKITTLFIASHGTVHGRRFRPGDQPALSPAHSDCVLAA